MQVALPSAVPLTIRSDGARLSAALYQPSGAPKAFVVIHGATGVPQSYYRHFAAWLAATQSIGCLTYDYRDFGASAWRSLRRSRATMADWGVKDQEAALAEGLRHADGAPLWVIGHSLGGFMTPFHKRSREISRLIAVASGEVNWRDHPAGYMPLALAFWFGPGPLAAALAGYMPGRLIGLGADLPAGVYWQWRRWCVSPKFNARDEARGLLPTRDPDRYKGELKTVALADDPTIPPTVVERLARRYPRAERSHLTIRPEDHGLRKVGHLGAFARRNEAIWPLLIA